MTDEPRVEVGTVTTRHGQDRAVDDGTADEVPQGAGGRVGVAIRGIGLAVVDRAVLVGLLVLAAVLRFVDLRTRGTWDADQGNDMLVLHDLVTKGVLPLLGPPTSIGDFHHGALYYYALAPAAWLGGSDPTIVVGEIALLGTAAVGLVWWIARAMAGGTGRELRGSIAGLVAGLAIAVSGSAVNESTFIWNPNLIPFSAALTVTAAWRAWTTRRARWWVLALAAQALTMQAHVLGAVFIVPLGGFLVADAARRTSVERRRVLAAAGVGVMLIAVSYLPLVAWELGHDFSESRAAVAFLTGGGQPVDLNPLVRVVFVGLRILSWPLTGLLTDALPAGTVAGVAVIVIVAWRLLDTRRGRQASSERIAVRWLALALTWCWLVLGLGIAGLATVTPLPVDHYHAFLDPLVFVVVGLGAAAAIARTEGAGTDLQVTSIGPRAIATVAVAALVAWNVAHWPPAVAPDGGWPAAQAAASRIERSLDGRTVELSSLPTFKAANAYAFPLVRDGYAVDAGPGAGRIVVVCDSLFVADCGGAAEASVSTWPVLDRFEAAPGRTITVFGRP